MEYKPYWLLEDWVNLRLVFYPTQSVVTPTMVHRTVLSRIRPSYASLVRTMTNDLVTSVWLSLTVIGQNR